MIKNTHLWDTLYLKQNLIKLIKCFFEFCNEQVISIVALCHIDGVSRSNLKGIFVPQQQKMNALNWLVLTLFEAGLIYGRDGVENPPRSNRVNWPITGVETVSVRQNIPGLQEDVWFPDSILTISKDRDGNGIGKESIFWGLDLTWSISYRIKG